MTSRPDVEEILGRLLAKVPADRFATAQQLADGMTMVTRPSPRRTVAGLGVTNPRRRRSRWIAGVMAGALVLGITWRVVISALPPPVPYRYVVLGSTSLAGQDSRYVGAVREELIRWRGVDVVRELEVLELIQDGGAPERPDDATRLARATRAAHLVRLEQTVRGDSLVFSLVLSDVGRSGTPVMYDSFACPIEGDECYHELRAATWRLLLGPGFERRRPGERPGTSSHRRASGRTREACRRTGNGASPRLTRCCGRRWPRIPRSPMRISSSVR